MVSMKTPLALLCLLLAGCAGTSALSSSARARDTGADAADAADAAYDGGAGCDVLVPPDTACQSRSYSCLSQAIMDCNADAASPQGWSACMTAGGCPADRASYDGAVSAVCAFSATYCSCVATFKDYYSQPCP